MKSSLRRPLARILPVVVGHGPWERFALRAALTVILMFAIRWGLPYQGQPVPQGIARVFNLDLTFLSDSETMNRIRIGVIACLAVYVAGFVPVLSLGFPLAVLIGVGTLINSQGAINHDTQIVGMFVLALVAVHSGAGIGRPRELLRPSQLWENFALHAAKITVAAGYMASAAVKLDETDGRWIADVPRVAVQLKKTALSKFYSDLEPLDRFAAETLPAWISEFPNLARLFFGTGLVLELFAFLLLAGRKFGALYAAALAAMHLAVGQIMHLHFDFNLLILAAFFIAPAITHGVTSRR